MPSSELTSIRGGIRDTLLAVWGEWGTWRAQGVTRRVFVKVQWDSKRVRELYAGSKLDVAEVYMSRDESEGATYPGVSEPAENSLLELDAELGRPLIFKGQMFDKSTTRLKIVMERPRRISTGGRP